MKRLLRFLPLLLLTGGACSHSSDADFSPDASASPPPGAASVSLAPAAAPSGAALDPAATYRFTYQQEEMTDRFLEQSQLVPPDVALDIASIRYRRVGSELLYRNGESSWHETGEYAFAPNTPADIPRETVTANNTIVYKDYAAGKTWYMNPTGSTICKVYDHAEEATRWEILDETKTYGDYLAQRAVRTDDPETEAWFTRQIPLADGPKTVSGLPGLVVDYHDGLTRLTLTGVEELTGEWDVDWRVPACR